MKAWHQTVAVAIGLSALAWVGSFSNGVPSLICPLPMVTILPAFFLALPASHLPPWIAVFVPVVLFLSWNPGMFRGHVEIPKRSWALLALLTALSVAYFLGTWKYGYQYQGPAHTITVCAVNIVWIALLWLILCRLSSHSSFAANLLFHGILFTWLAWYAFPYLGELL
jgi:hypothetical protein